jgi:ParB family chromosome partitioning protein
MTSQKRQRQPYQLKGVDALLGDSPESEKAAEFLPLEQIVPSLQQPRRYFNPQAQAELVHSLKQQGMLSPLLVRSRGTERYEVIAGERRYRAAVEAGLESVPVVVREVSDSQAWELALLENLQRVDLNPVEETEGILQLLAQKLNRSPEAAAALLNQAAHRDRESVDNVIHSEEWQLLENVFATVGKFTPESFRTNRLPLLKLPETVLEALRTGQLAYTKAKAIAKVKDQQQRQALLEEAITSSLSLSQIKERIKALQPSPKKPSPVTQLDSTYKRLRSSKLWENPKKWKRAQSLLQKLEALLEEE